jgi:hypothetical protein
VAVAGVRCRVWQTCTIDLRSYVLFHLAEQAGAFAYTQVVGKPPARAFIGYLTCHALGRSACNNH